MKPGPSDLGGPKHEVLSSGEPRQSTPDWVAGRIRDMIHGGELNVGDRLPAERILAEQLGIARLTLRAGLQIVREEGYIEARRGKGGGNTVTELEVPFQRWLERLRDDPEFVTDATELRVAVETHAVRLLAAEHKTVDLTQLDDAIKQLDGALSLSQFRASDAAFHNTIAQLTGSRSLAAAVRSTRGEIFVAANTLLATSKAVSDTRYEHRRIVELIRSGDADGAAEAVERHIRGAIEHVIDYVKETLGWP